MLWGRREKSHLEVMQEIRRDIVEKAADKHTPDYYLYNQFNTSELYSLAKYRFKSQKVKSYGDYEYCFKLPQMSAYLSIEKMKKIKTQLRSLQRWDREVSECTPRNWHDIEEELCSYYFNEPNPTATSQPGLYWHQRRKYYWFSASDRKEDGDRLRIAKQLGGPEHLPPRYGRVYDRWSPTELRNLMRYRDIPITLGESMPVMIKKLQDFDQEYKRHPILDHILEELMITHVETEIQYQENGDVHPVALQAKFIGHQNIVKYMMRQREEKLRQIPIQDPSYELEFFRNMAEEEDAYKEELQSSNEPIDLGPDLGMHLKPYEREWISPFNPRDIDPEEVKEAQEQENNLCHLCHQVLGTDTECGKPVEYSTLLCDCRMILGSKCLREWRDDIMEEDPTCLICTREMYYLVYSDLLEVPESYASDADSSDSEYVPYSAYRDNGERVDDDYYGI